MTVIGRFLIEKELLRDKSHVEHLCTDLYSSNQYILHLGADTEIRPDVENRELLLPYITKLREMYADPSVSRNVQFYGLLDGLYLIQASDPFIRKNAWSIEDLVSKLPANDLHLFSLWETIALQLMSEAHSVDQGSMSENEWNTRWGYLSGGPILVSAVSEYMDNGDLSRTEKLRVINRISEKHHDKPELAENILLRLLGGFTRGKMEPEDAIETLRCEHFRRNVTSHEIEQMSNALESLKNTFDQGGMDAKWIELILALLTVSPESINNKPSDYTLQMKSRELQGRVFFEARRQALSHWRKQSD